MSKNDPLIEYLLETRLGRLKPGQQGHALSTYPAVKVQVISVVPKLIKVPVQIRPISCSARSPHAVAVRSCLLGEAPLTNITPGERGEIRMENQWWAKTQALSG